MQDVSYSQEKRNPFRIKHFDDDIAFLQTGSIYCLKISIDKQVHLYLISIFLITKRASLIIKVIYYVILLKSFIRLIPGWLMNEFSNIACTVLYQITTSCFIFHYSNLIFFQFPESTRVFWSGSNPIKKFRFKKDQTILKFHGCAKQ